MRPTRRFAALVAAALLLPGAALAAGPGEPVASWWIAAGLALAASALAVGLLRARRSARAARQECRAKASACRSMAEAFDGLVYICSRDRRLEFMNQALADRIGRDAVGEPCHKALHGLDRTCPWCDADEVLAGRTVSRERQDLADGRWHHVISSPVARAHGSPSTLCMIRDITGQKRLEQALADSERRYRTVADYTASWEYWIDPQGRLVYISPACEGISGYAPQAFLDDPGLLEGIVHREDVEAVRGYLGRDNGSTGRPMDYRIITADGRLCWVSMSARRVRDEDGADLGLRVGIRDITEHKQMEIQLRHQALHDPLTGLANRVLCLNRIAQALERSKRRENYHYAVAFMDLDRFMRINDSYGHGFGDQVLEEISRRLQHSVRSLDLASRFGGDEFVLLLEELESPREALRIVKRARDAVQEPVCIGDKEVQVSATFGMVLSPAAYDHAEDLLRNANIALNRAKEEGSNRIRVFSARMFEAAMEHMTLENDLRRALAGGEFTVYYQPILALNDSSLKGFEALVRWQHPKKGLVPPGDFIPAAEQSGLIVEIGAWVLERSCQDMSRWSRDLPGAAELLLSVNLSARQFSDPGLVDRVRTILRETGIRPDRLKLEITETTIMENAELTVEKLGRLKELGLQISIDDFGTGYSSMSYLQRFPLDHLKIDLSFVALMDQGDESREIVRTIIQLAHSLGLKVVAEGVERTQQHDLLAGLDCEYGQGFLFSHPVPDSVAEDYIRSRPAVPG